MSWSDHDATGPGRWDPDSCGGVLVLANAARGPGAVPGTARGKTATCRPASSRGGEIRPAASVRAPGPEPSGIAAAREEHEQPGGIR